MPCISKVLGSGGDGVVSYGVGRDLVCAEPGVRSVGALRAPRSLGGGTHVEAFSFVSVSTVVTQLSGEASWVIEAAVQSMPSISPP